MAAHSRSLTDRENLAISFKNLAIYYANTGALENARDKYREALTNFQELAKAKPEQFNPCVAETMAGLADVLADLKDARGAGESRTNVVEIYQDLARRDPLRYGSKLAYALRCRAAFLGHQRQTDAARADYEAAIGLYQKLAKNTKWTDQASYGQALHAYAVFLTNQRPQKDSDVQAAKHAYRVAVEVYASHGGDHDAEIAAARRDWATLLYNTGELKEACDQFSAALEPAKRHWKKNSQDSDYGVQVCHYHLDLARACLDLFDAEGRDSYRKLARETITTAQRLSSQLPGLPTAELVRLEKEIADLKSRLNVLVHSARAHPRKRAAGRKRFCCTADTM